MVQGPSARSQSHVGALLSEYRGGGFTTGVGRSASESDSSEDTRSAAVSATRAYSSVSMLLQKWIAYRNFSRRTDLHEYLGILRRKKHV